MFRLGLTRWFVLSAWCIWRTQVATSDSKPSWTWNSTGDQCRPVVCSCYMDGVYYDEGEEWQDPQDPCVRYRCLENGFYKPIRSGCNFKGKCKKHNETWTEGCFLYRCDAGTNTWRYSLVQPGCANKKGDCLKVGERYMELCDTYECQIVGSCYTLTKVKTGCQSKKDGCKPVYSFWHDECALYQCTLDKGKSQSLIQTHSHDVMAWPRGEYALLETIHGCPPVFTEFWEEGYHAHWGEGHNDYSDDYHLKGNKTELMMEHLFCVHREVNDTALLPVYQTYFEQGRYCIMAYNGSCPKGFKEGMVMMADENKNGTNHTWGTLPDGFYNDLVTGMLFCCRDDGDIDKPIILPTRHPFALFMAANESKCQEVRGMNYKIEYFSHDDVNNGTTREMHGSLPAVKTADNNTLVYVCYYEPVMCGCVDKDEHFVALDDVIERACVKYQCKEEDNLKVLVVIEGGCEVEGKPKCVAENETWVETHGESCYTKQCVRQVDRNTSQITFSVETILKECRDGDQCRPLTYTKTHGCYSTQCRENNITGETSFFVTEAACSDGYGHCIEVGKTVKKDCIELKCNLEISKCSLVPAKGGCSFNGQCYDEGSTWIYACSNYTCINNSNKTHYQWKYQVINKGCLDHAGKCHQEGDRITKHCLTYECRWEDVPGFYVVSGGCSWRGKCHNANARWKEGCSTYNCTVFQNGTHTIRSVVPVHLGCHIGDKCVNSGDTYTKDCVTYTCHKGGKECGIKVLKVECIHPKTSKCIEANATADKKCGTYKCKITNTTKGYTRGFEPVNIGCYYDSHCYKANDTMVKDCTTYKCFQETLKSGYVRSGFKLSSYGCNYKGSCHNMNETFMDGCTKKVCRVYQNGNRIFYRIVYLNCKMNGHCYNINDTVKIGCSNYTCLEKNDHSGQRASMQRTSGGCTDPNTGKCIAANTTVEYYCGTYKCLINKTSKGYTRQLKTITLGCLWRGKCRKASTHWTEGCSTYNCTVIRNGTHTIRSVVPVHLGCKIGGKCVTSGDTYEKDCVTYKCQRGGKECGVKIYKMGCKYKDTCHKMNETFLDGCTKKSCRVYRVGSKVYYKVVSLNCKMNGECYNINETIKIGCSIYTCLEKKDHSCQRASMTRTTTGCKDNGVCRTLDEEYSDGCSTKVCRKESLNSTHYRLRIVTKGGKKCQKDGKCYDLGDTFKEVTKEIWCKVYSCQSDGKFYNTKLSKEYYKNVH
ncbi:uncharacterized protein LOC121379853 [Gigantopelta aegis]|uniref:uncharacterized protein LOC121379853 n=1 Tax=Gigantopelta aegis TaxID=1735272 RepID=UPI001B88DCA2|nr:uncharacterized protein LOC121379853 [Gigantopelta aegis]